MKRLLFAFLLLASGFSLLASAQSRTNRLTRPCAGSTTPATVAIAVDGSITATPCSGKTVKLNGVKVYRALISQSDKAAPTVTVLENSLGGTIVWSRSGVGDYTGTLINAFPLQSKTWLSPPGLDGVTPPLAVLWNNADTVRVFTQDGDSVLALTSIEILIYP